MDTSEIVQAVKKYAMDHYEEKFGWSEIVECFEDIDIENEFVAKSWNRPAATTAEEAIRRATFYANLREERYREAVGPDVKCQICGAIFPENTACPNEPHLHDDCK